MVVNLKYCLGFVDMCVQFIKSPQDNAKIKVEHIYTGPLESEIAEDMIKCDPEVSLIF
jgi:116 kDa U5 small nuclear ribonucleoprotein component